MNDDKLEEFNRRVNEGQKDLQSGRPDEIIEQSVAAPPTPAETSSKEEMWAVSGRAYFPCEQAVTTLPSGQYIVGYSERGIYFQKNDTNFDELMVLPDSTSLKVVSQIEQFWKREEHYRKNNFLWKRGVMLWGPPGSGKTCTLQLISEKIISKGGIAVYVSDPNLTAQGLMLLRAIEPNRPIVVMIEDIDAVIQNFGESSVLALLDGELQIDNVVFIATTNYPERLDKRIVNRPSRFDLIEYIGMPNDVSREIYLKAKSEVLANDKFMLKRWIKETEGFSVAHLKELIISVEVLEIPFEDALSRLKTMAEIKISSEDYDNRKIGFT